MAPSPRELHTEDQKPASTPEMDLGGDEVVITGMSGLLPGCANVMDFAEKLYAKENFITEENPRWGHVMPELSKYHGIVPKAAEFDAQFFMVFHKLGQSMDVITRKLLEHSYQAVYDSGISPTSLSGKSVGVYVAASLNESEKACVFAEMYLGILGCNRAMYANRISYYLNLKGPSMLMDADGAGAMLALEKAHEAILSGQCDAAIVGAAKMILHPQSSFHYNRIVPANPDGKTKCYDEHADGQSQSEAINVIFLQRSKDAKRVYATVSHVKTGFSARTESDTYQKFGPYREPAVLTRFLRQFYDEIRLDPSLVEYIEGNGAALPDADRAELQAYQEVFCKDRKNPLLVGSVTSNLGYTDPASGITAIMKVLVAYQRGEIAANLNCSSPQRDIPAICDGRMRIVNDHTPFKRTLAAVSSYGNTGMNGHVLLKGFQKKKDLNKYQCNIPHLVIASGRQESLLQKIFDDIKGRALDPEELALLNNIHKINIPKLLARGFGIYSTDENNKAVSLAEKVDYYDDARRPLWFVYSGMGSQWAGMGTQLMRVPVFAAAIEKCHKVLETKGLDLKNIITSPKKDMFDNILNSFVGIAAIQIGLTDVLRAVGLVPDNIIGHSVGELGCAYADECVTAEEMILMAYYRGLVSVQTPFVRGSMAAVGIGFTEVSKLIPPEIEVACHNGPESSTISGPADIMKEFVAKLTAQGIFAKEVPCSNIAYHSRYIAEAGPALLKYLSEVVKTPKLRSKRWISSSVPIDMWNEPAAMYSSAEYHTNNLLSSVLFEEASRCIPYNAVLVEIAPHGLLQAILKRSLPPDCHHVPLTRRGHADSALFLLEAVGKLYLEGYDIDVSALYPKVEYPVSMETRSLSPLLEWVNAEKWRICDYTPPNRKVDSVYKPVISIYDDEYQYLRGSIVEGVNVFPFAAALVSVWETLAMSVGKQMEQVTVKFKDIRLYAQPVISEHRSMHLNVMLQKGYGRFEVTYEHGLIADGQVIEVKKCPEIPNCMSEKVEYQPMLLTSDDFYKLMFERGYQYENEFRGINSASISLGNAHIKWMNNWVTFIDSLLQLAALQRDHDGISKPQFINRICIDLKQHVQEKISDIGKKYGVLDAAYYKNHDAWRCGGLLIKCITFKDQPALKKQNVILKELSFIPYIQQVNVDMLTALYIFVQIISENLNKNSLNVVCISQKNKSDVFDEFSKWMKNQHDIKLNVTMLMKENIPALKNMTQIDFVTVSDHFSDTKAMFEALYHCLPVDTFLISIGMDTDKIYPTSLCRKISACGQGKNRLELIRWRPSKSPSTSSAISIRSESDLKYLKMKCAELPKNHKLIILTPYPSLSGLKEMVQQLRSENLRQISVAMINHKYSSEQDIEKLPKLDLVFNVLDHGKWGGEYYVPLQEKQLSSQVAALRCTQLGNLNSLQWVEIPEPSGVGIPVKVHYAGLNVYDAKRATAEISMTLTSENGFGMDFSGVTKKGARVMGLVGGGALSTRVLAQRELIWPVPKHWSLEDAATVPLPYAMAFYCLGIKCRLIRGMTVLVHGGAGALGQAAIAVALSNGCTVFTTVSDIHKKKLLRQLFPSLPAEHIGNSRDETFKDMVLNATKGEGCHIIISSVKSDLKQSSLHCCAPSGTTLDTIQIHTNENYTYGMYNMTKSRSYVPIDFYSMFKEQKLDEMRRLQLMISEGIARGFVRPLTRTTYFPRDVQRAIRVLAGSRHRGRVLVELHEPVPIVNARIKCSSDSCHVLVCDTDVFSLQLCERLIDNGVKKLFIHCPVLSGYLDYKILSWQKQGVKVHLLSMNLDGKDAYSTMLKHCNRLAPIEGIFIANVDVTNKMRAESTISGLDAAAREICLSLKHFVVISDDESIGHGAVIDRARYGLPALMLKINNLEKYGDRRKAEERKRPQEALACKTALDAMEKAMQNSKPVILANAEPIQHSSILEVVAKIPGVNVVNNNRDRVTLEHIGVDAGRAQELYNILAEKFNIPINREALPDLTISKLEKLMNEVTDGSMKLTGLRGYFNYVESGELLEDMEVMRTRMHTTELRADEFEGDYTYLCIVPGMEGHHERFRGMCERLKIKAIVLQPGFDDVGETTHDIALRLVNKMAKKLELEQRHFYLLGYEIGVFVALEMAAILEERGLFGTVYCLGGTPEEIHKTMTTELGDINSKTAQDNILTEMYRVFSGEEDIDHLLEKVKSLQTWDGKVEEFPKALKGHAPYTVQFVQAILQTVYSRLEMIREYRPPRPIKSKIVIIRAKAGKHQLERSNPLRDFPEATVYEVNNTIANIPQDLNSASIINKHLEPDMLEEYSKRSRCEYSLINDSYYDRILTFH